jgi:hypothetical protein
MLRSATRQTIARLFRSLDYQALGPVYCDEGGAAFWRAKRGLCQRRGLAIAEALRRRLRPSGRSLYVGAGVAELPAMAMEVLELGREVAAYNLRHEEVRILGAACRGLKLTLRAQDATRARGYFDHIWVVSVLNDPEEYPELSALSYGRADPSRFSPGRFRRERRAVRGLVRSCLRHLLRPGLVTTSIEETVWIKEWCSGRGRTWRLDPRTYPTALVGDPLCFLHVG